MLFNNFSRPKESACMSHEDMLGQKRRFMTHTNTMEKAI